MRRGFEVGRAEPAFSEGPSCPPGKHGALFLTRQAQRSPGPRFSGARKLASPQGFPFIAPFPLSAVPPGPGLSKFLPLPPLPPPHPQLPPNPSRVQVSNPAGTPFFNPGVPAPRLKGRWGVLPLGGPGPACPHSSASGPREFLSVKRAGLPEGGPGRGEGDQALQGLSETERAELACVSEPRSLRRSRLGELRARDRGCC